MYIYIERERERDNAGVHIYTYAYIERERERDYAQDRRKAVPELVATTSYEIYYVTSRDPLNVEGSRPRCSNRVLSYISWSW